MQVEKNLEHVAEVEKSLEHVSEKVEVEINLLQ